MRAKTGIQNCAVMRALQQADDTEPRQKHGSMADYGAIDAHSRRHHFSRRGAVELDDRNDDKENVDSPYMFVAFGKRGEARIV